MKDPVASRGFTLLEMIMAVVILAIASIAVITMVANVGAHQDDNRLMMIGNQLLQECGENIISQHRRDASFFSTTAGSGSSNCYSLTSYATPSLGTYNPPSVVVADYAGSACPAGSLCKTATITWTSGGAALQPVTIMLVKWSTT